MAKKSKTKAGSQGNVFSPSTFMRARRPEQFSDSDQETSPFIDRSLLEYHLETLTNRNDERPFESFARRLAQRELCPNLIPQTGPTGGGDSKVDTETYPVAPEVSERWYEAQPNAGSERWAFAISAKKDWKPKVRSDIQKIIGTRRGYSCIYFISNQFIKDKDRSETEDALTRQHGVPVRILDRNWIVDKIFERKHFDIAIDALNIGVTVPPNSSTLGAQDATKHVQLAELESQISNSDNYAGADYLLAEDCLEAAILSRELELPRTEIEGRFARAERIATKANSVQQTLRIKYQRGWTACYWFDDFDELNRLYEEIEQLVMMSQNAEDAERLSNLWNSIFSGVAGGRLDPEKARIAERTEKLRRHLTALAQQSTRPNNAAIAETQLAVIDLVEKLFAGQPVDAALTRLAVILKGSENLGGYPFDGYFRFFQELGNLIEDSPQYDEAFEELLPMVERRRSEGAAGQLLLKRGLQKLHRSHFYEAIKLLGRAQTKLIKEEHQDDLVQALLVCGFCYQSTGLLWAAHSTYLAAASITFSEFLTNGRLSTAALRCIQSLAWIEIQLGRVTGALVYVQFEQWLATQLQLRGDDRKTFEAQLQDQDRLLAALLLRLSISQVSAMESLPSTFERLNLQACTIVLVLHLGHFEYLLTEGFLAAGTTETELIATLGKLNVSEDVKDHLPNSPELYDQEQTRFESRALGCEWTVTAPTNAVAIRIAESLLGFIESFFATSLGTDAIPHRQHVNIIIEQIDSAPSARDLAVIVGEDDFIARVQYSSTYDPRTENVDHKLSMFLREAVSVLIPRILYAKNIDKYFERIAGAEEGFSRSLTFANVFASASNVVEGGSLYELAEWRDDKSTFPLKRTEQLIFPKEPPPKPFAPTFGQGPPPKELATDEGRRHDQRRVFSVIDVQLWDAARWQGLAVAQAPNTPPIVALIFEDIENARKIFEGLIKRVTRKDVDNVVRVCIITGISRSNPSAYTVTISASLEATMKDARPNDLFVFTSRIKRVDNADPRNLATLLDEYGKFGCFFLAPAARGTGANDLNLISELGILKSPLVVRPAWQIGDNDPDFVALTLDDDPIIPPDVTDAPVLAAMKRMRKRKG